MRLRCSLLVFGFAYLFMSTQLFAQAAAESSAALPGKFVDITAKTRVNFQGRASHTAKKYLLEMAI
jgi:hypothetical protein